MKSFTFTLREDCPHCGNMVAVNGPANKTTCSSCQKEVTLTPAVWGDQLGYATRGSRVLGNPYKCIPAGDEGRSPVCPKCDGAFSFDATWIGRDFEFPCPHCDFTMSTYAVPDWLKAELPALMQIIGGDRLAEDGSVQPLEADDQAVKPVMLTCPNCSAGLKVTAASERTVACGYCGMDVYLPDGLWMRLHPVSTVHPWTVVYEGRLETAAEATSRQAEEQAEREAQLRRAAEKAKWEREAEEEEQRDHKRVVLVVVVCTVLPIVLTIILAVLFGLVVVLGMAGDFLF